MSNENEVDDGKFEAGLEDPFEVDIEDDTPEEDRNRTPLPDEIVQELEQDELDDYSEKVKTRLKQMKKVWHDERRAKEAALREQQEAVRLAQKMIEENKRLKSSLTSGEQTLFNTYKAAADYELDIAKREYKQAYESGDTDLILAAQEKLNAATYKQEQIKNYRPTLQTQDYDVNSNQTVSPQAVASKPDDRSLAWQKANPWWGHPDYADMTALALGHHQKLEKQYGKQFIGTDEYWRNIDETMKRRFPEYFGEAQTTNGGGKPVSRTDSKPATVVAPATRSTAPKKVVLTKSQLNLAKRLGLTPEQYAREYAKTMTS